MDQQRSALVKYKCFSCLPLSLTYALGLKSSLINHLVNDRLLDV